MKGYNDIPSFEFNWDSFKYRNYDYAIGRFMSVDPLAEKYPYVTLYQFAENTVIWARELEGKEAWYTTDENGELKRIEDLSGPLAPEFARSRGATHYGVLEDRPNYSFSNEEVQTFSDWNNSNCDTEPGACLGCAVTGSEMLTGANAGFRDQNGRNHLSNVSVYDLGENLENEGYATEFSTSQGNEINTIKTQTHIEGTENTIYLIGPAGGYHSLIVVYNTSLNTFSIYDQGTGWDIKNSSSNNVQNVLNTIDSIHPTWGVRLWQLNKKEKTEIIHPIEDIEENNNN